jgi:RNase P subunit RPR2
MRIDPFAYAGSALVILGGFIALTTQTKLLYCQKCNIETMHHKLMVIRSAYSPAPQAYKCDKCGTKTVVPPAQKN